jgi:hypothetical protein
VFNFNAMLVSRRGLRWRSPDGRCGRQVTPQQPMPQIATIPSKQTLGRLAAIQFDLGKDLGFDTRLAGDGYPKTLQDFCYST